MKPGNWPIVEPHTRATFQALVEAIIPYSPTLARFGNEQTFGALEEHIDEFMILKLDKLLTSSYGYYSCRIILSRPTAFMLDAAATQLIVTGQTQDPQTFQFPYGGPFTTLSRNDRFRAIELLEKVKIDLGSLPPPYQYNAGLVKFISGALNWMTTSGYYSEWSGYGSTRLGQPDNRRVEFFPISWLQVGYPGPAYGYRDFRGFLLNPSLRGRDDHDL
ncbi:MAG TPA: hypothetical protein VJ824_06830 [Bacillota bacterium]|nr:hypothetical protein [Bacillota bacterium]